MFYRNSASIPDNTISALSNWLDGDVASVYAELARINQKASLFDIANRGFTCNKQVRFVEGAWDTPRHL